MSLTVKAGGGNFVPVSQNVHMAVCVGLYDLGTQFVQFRDKDKHLHKCLIMWEIPGERIDIEKDGATLNLPRVISKEYTVSLDDRANLYKDLMGWRGLPFTDEELKCFDLKNILGKSCQLQVIHKKTEKGVYANIFAIMPFPRGMKKLEPEAPLKFYSIQDNGMVTPEGTPQWIIDKIKRAEEFTQIASGGGDDEPPPIESDQGQPADENVPF